MKPQDLLARLEAGYAYDPMYGELCNERDRLSDENAKLRELCADLYAEMLTYSTAPNYNASVWAVKLRELGIEVER